MIDPLMIASVTVDESRANAILRTSPDLSSKRVTGVIAVVKRPNNVTITYNKMLQEQRGRSEYIALVHDDVYLPEGWTDSVIGQIALINATDPEWACLGVAGVLREYSNSHAKTFEGHLLDCGEYFHGIHPMPCMVDTLDEVCVIFRNDGETRLNTHLKSHHLWAAEYCLRMKRAGQYSYAIDAFLEHRKKLDENEPDIEIKRMVRDFEFYFNAGMLMSEYPDMMPIVTNCMSLTWDAEHGVEMLR